MTSEFWAVFEEESCKRLKNSGLWIAFGGTTESTGKCRFHRQAQNRLFDCAVRKFANGFAQDDTPFGEGRVAAIGNAKQPQRQTSFGDGNEEGHYNCEQQPQKQQQIPSLRYGMTNKYVGMTNKYVGMTQFKS